jgi:RsiW-degrading membrane proteinase PrsW (M82 family)
MGNVASLRVEAKRTLRGILGSRRIQGLELGKKAFFFLSGVLISIPLTLYVREFVDPLLFKISIFDRKLKLLLIFRMAIFTPFLEEFAKAYPIMYRSDDERSLFTLGSLVGLGFGIAESIMFISRGEASINIRLLPTLFHAASTAIAAYGIAKDKPIRSYLAAVTLHSLNNLFVVLERLGILRLPWIVSIYPVLLATFSIAVYLHRKTSPIRIPEFGPAPGRIDNEMMRND